MKIYLAIKVLITTSLLGFTCITQLNAQSSRTWVSGTGDDANPCSRTSPCKTFGVAITKTTPGGEIDAIDSGGFGTVTITKAITIDGTGTLASVLSGATNAIVVSAGANDVVILRNLSLNGESQTVSPGLSGVQFNSGKMLVIEDCMINGFTISGINVNLSTAGDLVVENTLITNCPEGVTVMNGTGNPINVSLSNVSIKGSTTAVHAFAGNVTIGDSLITQNVQGVLAESGSQVNCIGNIFSSNGTAIQSLLGAIVRISNNSLYNNTTGIGSGGGTVATANNNNEAGSTTTASPNASIITQ